MKQLLPLLALLFFTCASIAAQQKAHKHNKPVHSSTVKTGTASYYAAKFQGKQMANGQKFDQTKLTAACNVLSLGTWVKVSNLRNKKSVIVRITDRMHPKNKRLIDVSKAAAQKLGFVGRGLTKVKVEVVEKP
ncbi:MAG: septal ring lytic transglycosylase RlpA family protein [Agriterribacter sp.]